MDVKDVQKLIKLMEEHGLSEIEIEDEKGKIRLKKENGNIQELIDRADTAAINQNTGSPGTEPPKESPAPKPDSEHICSPLVGTFYLKPDQDGDPYVKKGDHVDEDTVVCVVEAMKVMNEIKAEKSGTITGILVEDGHPVEYMQPIFEIKPD
jgi:acetyl-CoA carboxylase biotin carboxyl carrier protein